MIPTLQKAAKEAGDILLQYFQKGVLVSYKTSHQNIVTKADIAAQEIIQKIITKEMKLLGYKKEDIGFIGEENLNIRGKHIFIIDPLDGTTNFAHGIKYFCVSIAYAHNNEIKAAVIYNPSVDTFYSAEKGKGAFKRVSHQKQKLNICYKRLNQCLAGTFITTNDQYRQRLYLAINKIYPKINTIRIWGSIALCLCQLSENTFNIYFEISPYIWDITAAKLIVEESGGVAVDWKGNPIVYDFNHPEKPYQIIACHPKILPEILKFFKKG